MESPVNGVDSLSEVQNSVSGVHHDLLSSGTPRPSRPPLRASRNHQTKTIHHQNSHVINQKPEKPPKEPIPKGSPIDP